VDVLPLIIFFIVANAIGIVLMTISKLLGYKQTKKRLNDVYESGVNPYGSATKQYDIKFFLTAILFLLFDVDLVFLLPWAMGYQNSTDPNFMVFGFIFFMVILLVGYVYVLTSQSLKWEE
jgi:NADH-quinone oxidoreductase subunit A